MVNKVKNDICTKIIKDLYSFNFDGAYNDIYIICEYILKNNDIDEIKATIVELTKAMNTYDVVKIVDILNFLVIPLYQDIILLNKGVE